MSENCRKCAGRLVAAKLQTLTELARLARFERATAWFVARYSIQLSYRRVRGVTIGNRSLSVKGLSMHQQPPKLRQLRRFNRIDSSRYNPVKRHDITIVYLVIIITFFYGISLQSRLHLKP